MCGRFTLDTTPEEMTGHFDLETSPPIPPRFNIAPSQLVAVVAPLPAGGKNGVAFLKWGLVPNWSQDGKPSPINARSESVAHKDTFADAFARQRCLIPTTGFYEWIVTGGKKLPRYFRQKGGGLMAFAGLWSVWVNPDTGKKLATCCMLTTKPNELVKPVHDRMPVILRLDDYPAWLDNDTPFTDLKALLKPYPAELMEAWFVDQRVNKATVEGPELVQPVEAA